MRSVKDAYQSYILETEVASEFKYCIAVETAAFEAKITLSLEAVLT